MIEIPVFIQPDENGYIDRECPNENCQYIYKVLMKDWEEKISEEVHCPLCGYIANSDKWWTQDQIEKMQEIAVSWALSEAQKQLQKSFKNIAKSTRRNKFVRITYKPGRRISFINNPIGQQKEWETEICCDQCGTRYSVIGAAYFCPCCGYNSAVKTFNDSLDGIEKMIDSLDEMKNLLIEKYNEDAAETMCRSMLEGTITEAVSAFQKFASCIYEGLNGKKSRVNDFQIIKKGSDLFERETGYAYSDYLDDNELQFMELMFQRRHLLEHNNGMVDDQYLTKTGDVTYSVGQRIIAKKDETMHLLEILKKLGNQLIKIEKIADNV